jgi:hypothetical protein
MLIDWQQLALNLRAHKPLSKLSLELGKANDYLGHLSRDETREPKFSDGIALLNLHLDVCGIEKHRSLLKT